MELLTMRVDSDNPILSSILTAFVETYQAKIDNQAKDIRRKDKAIIRLHKKIKFLEDINRNNQFVRQEVIDLRRTVKELERRLIQASDESWKTKYEALARAMNESNL